MTARVVVGEHGGLDGQHAGQRGWHEFHRLGCWISAEQLEAMARPMLKNGYGQYLMQVLGERVF